MSKLNLTFQVPPQYDKQTVTDIVRAISDQVNELSEGSAGARYQAQTVIPSGSAVSYGQSDFIWDSKCVERGVDGDKYVRIGWVCVSPGTPGELKEMRVRTDDTILTLLDSDGVRWKLVVSTSGVLSTVMIGGIVSGNAIGPPPFLWMTY